MSENKAYDFYRFIRENKLTEENISKLESMGMIRLKDLKHGHYYKGICRNSSIAEWICKPEYPSTSELPNKLKQPCFIYMRHKFNSIFIEEINHPEMDDGFDLFIPLEEIAELDFY